MKKRLLTLLFCGIMAVSLSACGNDSEPDVDVNSNKVTETTDNQENDNEITESAENTTTPDPTENPEPTEEPEPTVEPAPSTAPTVEAPIFEVMPEEFYFASGAGAWETDLFLNDDGTFTGIYHDTNAGEIDDNYPNGTVYVSVFSGKFTEPEKMDEGIYSMKLESLEYEEIVGEEEYIDVDGIRIVHTDAYGLENADNFIIYEPGLEIEVLPEGFVNWLSAFADVTNITTLPYYGIYNVNAEEAFIGYIGEW